MVFNPPLGTHRSFTRWLLLISSAFLTVNALALVILRPASPALWHTLIWAVCAAVGWLALHRALPDHDPLLFPVVMFLSGWGIILIDRLAPAFGDRQTLWLVVSILAMLFAALSPAPLRWLRDYRYTLLLGGLALLLITILLGRNPSDPNRLTSAPQLWLLLGPLSFQPSEILKIILVAFLASYLAEHYPVLRAERLGTGRWFAPRLFGPVLLMWGVSVMILVWQRDLGTAILFFVVFLVLVYIATGSLWILLIGGGLIVVAAFIAYHAFAVVRLRVDIWLDPWPESDGRAYQIVQSLLAFAAGGPFGQGIAQGSPTYIPVVHSDFVFAAIAEEWGLLGVLNVVVLFAIIIMRGLTIALAQGKRPFGAMLTLGLTLVIATQTLLIMMGVLKLLPLTGVTLPFLSYGGSSLLACFVMVGLLLRLSAQKD